MWFKNVRIKYFVSHNTYRFLSDLELFSSQTIYKTSEDLLEQVVICILKRTWRYHKTIIQICRRLITVQSFFKFLLFSSKITITILIQTFFFQFIFFGWGTEHNSFNIIYKSTSKMFSLHFCSTYISFKIITLFS